MARTGPKYDVSEWFCRRSCAGVKGEVGVPEYAQNMMHIKPDTVFDKVVKILPRYNLYPIAQPTQYSQSQVFNTEERIFSKDDAGYQIIKACPTSGADGVMLGFVWLR